MMPTATSDFQEGPAPNFISRLGTWPSASLEDASQAPRAERAPILVGAPPGQPRSTAWSHFYQELARSGQLPILFGLEPQDLEKVEGWTITLIGRQPLFQAGPWCTSSLSGNDQPNNQRYLRRQARRTERKGVFTSRISLETAWRLREEGAFDHLLWQRWLSQALPEFPFLVAFDWTVNLAHRRFFLSSTESGEILALTLLLNCDRGWLLEHQLLSENAPNGTSEQVLCHLLSEELEPGEWLSLGLTPLFDDLQSVHSETREPLTPTLLAPVSQNMKNALFRCWEPLYGFQKIAHFREKLEPQAWEPVYWAHPPETPSLTATWKVLRTFAGGSFLLFGVRFLIKALQRLSLKCPDRVLGRINLFFLLSLLIWVPILMLLDGPGLFGHPQGAKIWACYDLLLILGFAWHQRYVASPRRGEYSASRLILMGLLIADATLSWLGTLWLFGGFPADLWQAGFLGAINSAPILALLFLGICHLKPEQPTQGASSFGMKGGG